MMKIKENLLRKYYDGETSEQEEQNLKELVLKGEEQTSEKDIFAYYQQEGSLPDNLEETIFSELETEIHRKITMKRWIFTISSAAAAVLIFITIYLNIQHQKNEKIEAEFFVMEQALYQISESIQPEEENDMLVLWVDDNVEIIVN